MKKILPFLLSLISGISFAQSLDSSVLIKYPFSGNANDVSGNGIHGIVNGAVLTQDRFNNANSAYYFDGMGTHIEIPTAQLIGLNEYTYSFWFKPDMDGLTSGIIVSIGGSHNSSSGDGFDQGASYHTGPGYVFGGSYNNGTNPIQTKVYSEPIDNSVWTHVVITRNMEEMNIYINGVKAIQNGIAHQVNNQDAFYGGATEKRARLGIRCFNTDPNHYRGAIDEFTMYNRVLDSVSVQTLYINSLTSVGDIEKDTYSINVYPNPTKDIVIISNMQANSNTVYKVRVLNSIGQNLFNSEITQPENKINISDIGGPGIYLLEILDKRNNVMINKKIVLH